MFRSITRYFLSVTQWRLPPNQEHSKLLPPYQIDAKSIVIRVMIAMAIIVMVTIHNCCSIVMRVFDKYLCYFSLNTRNRFFPFRLHKNRIATRRHQTIFALKCRLSIFFTLYCLIFLQYRGFYAFSGSVKRPSATVAIINGHSSSYSIYDFSPKGNYFARRE